MLGKGRKMGGSRVGVDAVSCATPGWGFTAQPCYLVRDFLPPQRVYRSYTPLSLYPSPCTPPSTRPFSLTSVWNPMLRGEANRSTGA